MPDELREKGSVLSPHLSPKSRGKSVFLGKKKLPEKRIYVKPNSGTFLSFLIAQRWKDLDRNQDQIFWERRSIYEEKEGPVTKT